ncbi:glycoprotease family-domain-containing protein [Rhodofomes roseus]|uniref:N(6)-L-threonylcarbamoyladenine synthase n=1 Tax=Rhodofomes roseus TaxID=34475 RepID=A0ABQ8K1Y2_9APHY|nr:glycoprotease family-domain-containing protein [Rhodofomes roseus]KAH9830728.1 glycoprotease family-domain-containing protein [Rhodofomes roseus]
MGNLLNKSVNDFLCRKAEFFRCTKAVKNAVKSISTRPSRTHKTSAVLSCAAVVTSDRRILSNVVIPQHDYHLPSGVISTLLCVVQKALDDAGTSVQDVDGIAYTREPGMTGCLSVGSNAMRTLAAALKKPLDGLDHMQAHALTPFLTETEPADMLPTFPFLSLLVTAGNTLLLLVKSPRDSKILAATKDMTIGGAIEKVARSLKLPRGEPGLGASLEEYLRKGPPEGYVIEKDYEIPLYSTPMPGRLEFSFASERSDTDRFLREREEDVDECTGYAVAYAFQKTIVPQLEGKLKLALRACRQDRVPIKHLVVSGGVASNMFLRQTRVVRVVKEQDEYNPIELIYPPVSLCTDNAAIIAWALIERFLTGDTDPYSTNLVPKWSVEYMFPANRKPIS